MNVFKLANPVHVTKGAFGVAGTAVGLADTVARETAHLMLSCLQHLREAGGESPQPTSTTTTAADAAAAEVVHAPRGPVVVLAEPHAPEEPPIDVVGETLAAEAAAAAGEGADGAAFAHEPRGASRDEEHGDRTMQRAEVDEIAEEAAAALEGDNEPPVHLTEPLLDADDAQALADELRNPSRPADPDS